MSIQILTKWIGKSTSYKFAAKRDAITLLYALCRNRADRQISTCWVR